MRIAVAGSIATDHLMSFEGRFAEQIIPEQIQQLSLSFLIDELDVRRGGVAANICFGMGRFGLDPVLVGAAGADFEDYRAWLDRHGVDTSAVYISELRHTARFICTTDRDQNQIASFYAGAMAEARNIELRPIADRVGGLDLVLIGADDPAAMVRHSEECRTRGIAFAADPSQQLARMEGPKVRTLVEGALFLFANEYEKALAEQKTGWSDAEVLSRVGTRVTTLGAKGARIDRRGEPSVHVPAAVVGELVDPTGVGDAFRAGFLAAHSWGLSLERAAQVGNATAVHCLEADGPQEYTLTTASLLDRLERSYGAEAAAEVEPFV
ncbi:MULTISPECIES: carbohydrate kinase family protein [Nocardiopsis]|uniref:Adenosine kinase n=1 Tax=Nocardiopsis sinuspersici TaxID=501010 RepID=A0A1V3C1Q1_9ACTN|nr:MULTISPECIES: carbohydrate kinase family protein [Nocardiopsis]NYH50909.1 adenosine kinase [Nocardiopsis sinuspersici]OOC54724.1 ribokinase [Nocardiopsis sinuspersici]